MARALGLTESRITQVTALLGLSPAMQEEALLGDGGTGIREAIRAARDVRVRMEGAVEDADGSFGCAMPS